MNCLDLIVVEHCIEGVLKKPSKLSYPLDLKTWMPQSKLLLLIDSPALSFCSLYTIVVDSAQDHGVVAMLLVPHGVSVNCSGCIIDANAIIYMVYIQRNPSY